MYVSCDAKNLYRGGGWFDDGKLLNELALGAASKLGPDWIAEIFPPYRYQRPLPVHLSAGDTFRQNLNEVYGRINDHYCAGPASALMRIENASVAFSTIYMTGNELVRIVYETHRPNDRPYAAVKQPEALLHPEQVFTASKSACYMLLASVGSANYGHWLVDDLARLKAFHVLRKLHPERTIKFMLPRSNSVMDRVRIESINHVLSNESGFEVNLYDPKRLISFSELYYVTPISYHPMIKSPYAIDWLSTISSGFPLAKLYNERPFDQKIFVTRRANRGRYIHNIDQIESLVTGQGFVVIDPEGMSFTEQALAFSRANVIVGCMGAAMTNALFSQVASTILMLAPEGWIEPFYWDLAASRGHSYSVCYGVCTQTDVPAHKSSYEISAEVLENILSILKH